jgi:hypothetical protein
VKPRGTLLVALGVGAAVVALALFLFSRTGTGVCPAIGYAYVGPVELRFSHEPASVAVCFEEGCTPAPLAKSPDGKWLVPQSAPYLVPTASAKSVYVEAALSSGSRIARTFSIDTEPTGEYPYGRECGGPYRFTPVNVPLGLAGHFPDGLPETSQE